MDYAPYFQRCTENGFDTPNCDYIETLIVRFPDFINRAFTFTAPPLNLATRLHYNRLINRFDDMPMAHAHCRGHHENCQRPVTRFAMWADGDGPDFYCDQCEPAPHQVAHNFHTTYREALRYGIHSRLKRRRIIRAIANAKGLTGNFTEGKVAFFFYQNDVPAACH